MDAEEEKKSDEEGDPIPADAASEEHTSACTAVTKTRTPLKRRCKEGGGVQEEHEEKHDDLKDP